MPEYTLTYRRVMTVESDTELSRAELVEHAKEALHDGGALWSVQIDGDAMGGGEWWSLNA